MMGEISSTKNGNIILENRKKLTVSGIRDVESFLSEKIILVTDDGNLTVTGAEMKVKKLSVENGEAVVEGEISGCVYSKGKSERESFLKRVLK